MEAKNFIYQELNEFIKLFPKTRIRYEYDDSAFVHIVEVSPKEVYNSDNDYIQWEDNFWKQFVSKFPAENICFISDDDVINIEKPELTLTGTELTPFSSKETSNNKFSTNVIFLKDINNSIDYISMNQSVQNENNFTETVIPNSYFTNKFLNAA